MKRWEIAFKKYNKPLWHPYKITEDSFNYCMREAFEAGYRAALEDLNNYIEVGKELYFLKFSDEEVNSEN